MKKIYLQLTPFYPTPKRFYGPYIYDQVKAIERNSDYEVVVIKLHPFYSKESTDPYVYQGTRVYNFKFVDLPSSTLPGIFHRLNTARLENFIEKELRIPWDRIAFLHAHSIYPAGALAVSLGRRHGIASLVQHHGLDIFQEKNIGILKGWLKELNIAYMKKRFLQIANEASLNIGVSQKVIDVLEEADGFDNKNLYVLYNGVDRSKFFRKVETKRESEFTIGCIGNFFETKDHMTLLRAVKILHERGIEDIELRLIGSGYLMESCRAFVSKSGLDGIVQFEREMDHTMLNDFYNSLDLFVLPSYYEAFGCVYTEAMQCGVPVIAVKGQGIEEVIREEDRPYSLIEPGDDRRLAELIEFRYNHRSKIDYNFDIDIFIQKFLQHIEKLA